jgi:hypothetical protein
MVGAVYGRSGSVLTIETGSVSLLGIRLVENVVSTWNKTAATRGTQMIFADMGVNPTPWGYTR